MSKIFQGSSGDQCSDLFGVELVRCESVGGIALARRDGLLQEVLQVGVGGLFAAFSFLFPPS